MTDPRVHKIAAFDFDGTSIKGNSPVMLVRYLQQRHMLGKRVLLKILSWATAYKLRLPQSEEWVRGLVFTAFEGKPCVEVDAFLREFCDEIIVGRNKFKDAALQEMRQLQSQGVEVVIVSASFEPIVRRAQEHFHFDAYLSTCMKVDCQGNYTTKVDGACVEGKQKVIALEKYANEKYGEGNWQLLHAYGDHHSDAPMLRAAVHAHAVTPDNPLERLAKREGWIIEDWK